MEFHTFNVDYVTRLAAGDREVEAHFTTYFGDLLALKLRGRMRSREMLEDVRQTTFQRVLDVVYKGELEHPERLGAFVNSVCNNVLAEGARNGSRYRQLDEAARDWADGRIDLDAPLINQERRRLVEDVLAKLRRRDRDLLRMVFFEEVDMAEACQRMGVDASHLRVLLHRAKSRLRAKLPKQPGSPT